MRTRYPQIEPYDQGMLDVGDGHRIYWATSGNPAGKPAVVLHGGPGTGSGPGLRRYFDPAAYRIVQFDQRNCGRSTPSAALPTVDLSTNTTRLLIGDIERLQSPDQAVREQAARDWCAWEDTHVATAEGHEPYLVLQDLDFQLTFARLVTHYWANAGFLEDGQLMRDAGKLAGIPAVLVHGVMDISGPADIAWHLAQAWPDAELILIDRAGHGTGDERTVDALIEATDRFAG